MDVITLINHAKAAQKFSQSQYSQYAVGAALLSSNGIVTNGCNIESKAYPTTMCAERVAIYAALSQGITSFSQMAIITKDGAAPCGACRQVISEYCGNIPIHYADEYGNFETSMMDDLLPLPFRDNHE